MNATSPRMSPPTRAADEASGSPTTTYDAGQAEQIPPGEGREVVIGGRRIAVFRTRTGDVFATQAVCPHRAGPLADGLIGGTVVACPLHEFRFDLSTGRPLGNDCPVLRTYPTRIDDRGHILISIPKTAPQSAS